MTNLPLSLTRRQFLISACLFEGGLGMASLLFGWLTGIDPFADLLFEQSALSWGILGTLPLLLLFWQFYTSSLHSLQTIKQLLIEQLGPLLTLCRWYDLLLLAVIAGIGEELLFRGFLQPWITQAISPLAGLIISNILFGLVHMVTLTYALLAAAIGLYLGMMLNVEGQPNLLTPIIIHSLYDYLAFLVVVQSYRENQRRD